MQKFLPQRVLTVTFLSTSATFVEKIIYIVRCTFSVQAATLTGKPLIYFSVLISPKNFYFLKTNDSTLHVTNFFLSAINQWTTVKRQPRPQSKRISNKACIWT